MANQWFRMYSEFATDPKVQMLSETFQRRYIMLLCIRCNVSSNNNETLIESLQDENIAFQLRISNDEWLETKATLINKKLIDVNNNPINWDKRQFLSDISTVRVRKHRAKKKQEVKPECNVSETPPDTDTDTDTDTDNNKDKSLLSSKDKNKYFSMFETWLPDPKLWQTIRMKSGVLDSDCTEQSLKEFIGHWQLSPDKVFTEGQWQNKLAKDLMRKRRFKEVQNNGKNQQGNRQDSSGIEHTATDNSWRSNST